MIYQNIEIKELSTSDVDAIMRLQEEIFDTLENPDILRRNTREMFELCTQAPNWTIGAYGIDAPEKLVGLAIMFDPGDSDENIANHLKKHTVQKSANAKLIMILKEYRGIGFQKFALKLMEERAARLGYDGICATVSPQNEHSKNNLIACGYEYDHDEIKYGGLQREVFVKAIAR